MQRLGSATPMLTSSVTTFHMLSSQATNTDPIFGDFRQANGNAVALVGSLQQVCTIAPGLATVTTQVRGAPGVRWTVSSMCAGAAADMLLQDTTQNTWAIIDSVSGGIATVSEPLPNASLTTVQYPSLLESTVNTNDAFVVWAWPKANLKAWNVTGSDGLSSGAISMGWVQDVEVTDTSAGSFYSTYGIAGHGYNIYSRVRMDPPVVLQQGGGRTFS